MSFNNLFCVATAIALTIVALQSCNTPAANSSTASDTTAATKAMPAADSLPGNIPDNNDADNATLYFTIADTGQDYFTLRGKMFALNSSLHWNIDTMGRYYDVEKKQIVVSDTDEDEMYRGEYEPRRFPSETMSLEYYHTYIGNSTVKNIALVTGIYETRKSADSSLAILRPYAPHAFVVAADVYLGCMH